MMDDASASEQRFQEEGRGGERQEELKPIGPLEPTDRDISVFRLVHEQRQIVHNQIKRAFWPDYYAEDLNFSKTVLFLSVYFYRTYKIVPTLSGQLSGAHYQVLITVKGNVERRLIKPRRL